MAARKGLDMTTGPIFRKLLLFAYPLMINSVVNTLYGIADQVIAGQYIGDVAIAAVGVCSSPINLIISAFTGMASGVSVLCGNFIGGNQKEDLRKCMHCAPVIGLLLGLVLCLLGIAGARPLLTAMDTPDSVLSSAVTYMTIRMMGIPFEMTGTFCLSIFTAHGDTKRITLSGLVSGFVNILGNLFFVVVVPIGISGIALATVLSQTLSMAIKVAILFAPRDIYRMRVQELRLHMQYVKQIIRIGLPNGMNSIAFNFSNVLLQSSVNTFGAAVIAGNTAADTVATLVIMFPSQINAACSCAVAQCFGAKNFQRIKDVIKKGIFGTIVMTAIAGVIVTLCAKPLMGMFTDSAEVAEAGVLKLMFSIWSYILYIFAMIYAGALSGMRRSSVTMVRNLLGICLPRILWVWFVFPFFPTPVVLYLIKPLSNLISAILLGTAFRKHLRKARAEELPAPL